METWKIVILIAVFILCASGAWYAIKLRLKEIKDSLYVYPKTGHKYMPLYMCKLKCPASGEWVDAVVYQDMENGRRYVREFKDFFGKFIKYEDFGKCKQ